MKELPQVMATQQKPQQLYPDPVEVGVQLKQRVEGRMEATTHPY